jgi:hypothetical protein
MRQSFLVLLCLAVGGSCLGDSSTGDVAGLSLPSGVDLVTVAGDAGGTALAAATNTNFPAGSDFATDRARRHVWDQSTEPLEIINDILSQLAQTCADKLVNQGPYVALIELNEDEQGGGAGNQSSAGNAIAYEPWIVDSTRASASAPQVVRFWIEGEETYEQNQTIESVIHAYTTVTAEADAQNPFGQFSIDYAMTEGTLGEMFQRGTLAAGPASGGLAGFTFLADAVDPQFGGDVQIAVETNASRTAGRARVRVVDELTQQIVQYLIAFDGNLFARKIGNQVQAFDRDRFLISTWGYNLYHGADGPGHTAGERVELESGFPFTFTYQGANEYGHVGYWGIWSPRAGVPAHGAVIKRDERNGQPQRQYTVVRAPGKLVHVQRVDVLLAAIDGAEFEYYEFGFGDRFIVRYVHDEQNGWGVFEKTALWNQQTQSWDVIDPPSSIPLMVGDWLGLWSRSLGGSVSYVGGDASVTIQQETYVSGSDALFGNATELTLYGVTQCLKPAMTAAQVEMGDIWFADADPAQPRVYEFGRSARTLTLNGARVGLMPGEVPDTGPFVWGMRSGPLTTTPPAQLGITEPWEMWNLSEYYYWETGHNEWNQFATVRDAQGELLTFDAPIGFLYQHELGNDANGDDAFAGQSFWLEYGGSGQLWGIPYGEVDVDGDQQPDRWLPLFSLADGVVLGPDDEYVVRAIESELTMLPALGNVPPAVLQALTAAAQLVLPTLADWSDPVDPNLPQNLGEPRVVGGKLLR